jgi:predicted HicB family RNase H-like nuclease
MAKRRPPAVTPTTPIGDDIDVNAERVTLPDGARLTEDRADDIVEQVRSKGGRPSLTGDAAASPRVSFRVTPDIRNRAAALADREGKTISQLAREALEARVRAS